MGLADKKTIWLTDSASTLGVMVKGRSSIKGILARCRKAAATIVAHNVQPLICFVPTNSNPADAPFRLSRCTALILVVTLGLP